MEQKEASWSAPLPSLIQRRVCAASNSNHSMQSNGLGHSSAPRINYQNQSHNGRQHVSLAMGKYLTR